MNTQSNAISGTGLRSQELLTDTVPASRRMYWLVRRELFENRWIYIAPTAVAVLFLLGFLVSLFGLPGRIRGAAALDAMQRQMMMEQPFTIGAMAIMAAMFFGSLYYCLEALHGERRDRSILFWKSLPVSDLDTVLSKAAIPIVVFPLIAIVLTFVTHVVMLLMVGAVLLASGTGPLWRDLPILSMWQALLFHLIFLHGLWSAPLYAWLMLVSAWARRAVLLWAVLPPLAVGVFERVAFGTTHFGNWIGYRFGGPAEFDIMGKGWTIHPMAHIHLGHFLLTPGLWLGLVMAAGLLMAAARVRRSRGPI